MQTSSPNGKESKPSSKGKNARFAGESDESSGAVSSERLVCWLGLVCIKASLLTRFDFSDRAFADYIFGSLILHFFCVNFIN